jgi:hypothetical protein
MSDNPTPRRETTEDDRRVLQMTQIRAQEIVNDIVAGECSTLLVAMIVCKLLAGLEALADMPAEAFLAAHRKAIDYEKIDMLRQWAEDGDATAMAALLAFEKNGYAGPAH